MDFSPQAPGCEIDDVMDFEAVARAASTTAATASTTQPQQHPAADFFDPTVGVEMPSLNLDDISRHHENPALDLDCLGDPSSCLETLSDVAITPTSFPIDYHQQGSSGDHGDSTSVYPLQTADDKYDALRKYSSGGGQFASLSAGFGDSGQKRQARRPAATTGASCFDKTSGGERVDRFRLPATAQHNNTRAARNGREQQRAQKISDMIDKLKTFLDKAEFASSDISSKLHVLTNCETYLRRLLSRTKCYELEAKLRAIANTINDQSQDATDTNCPVANGGGLESSAETCASDGKMTPTMEGRGCSSTGSLSSRNSSSGNQSDKNAAEPKLSGDGESNISNASLSSRGHTGENLRIYSINNTDNDGMSNGNSSSSSNSRWLSCAAPSPHNTDNVAAVAAAARTADAARSSASEGGGGSGSSGEDDGDNGSSDDGGGGTDITSVGTTDSGSLGSTTDTASRGFTTDSGYGDGSFGGDSGSADSSGDAASGGDAGSADGSSESSEGGGVGSRMRIVNYFDIFRLSNVPMAIASKDGALVDLNDAMRGFGRIDHSAVKTLTIRSLVSPQSAQALDDAMARMLTPPRVPQDGMSGDGSPHQQPGTAVAAGSQPFIANAGIGDRPTLMTVSLVYDDRGKASAFHVALIPRSTPPNVTTSGGTSSIGNAIAPPLTAASGASSSGDRDGMRRGGGYGRASSQQHRSDDDRFGRDGIGDRDGAPPITQGGSTEESWGVLGRRNVRFREAAGVDGDVKSPAAKRQAVDGR